MKTKATTPTGKPIYYQVLIHAVTLAFLLLLLFWRSFLPDYIHFANDGPLGQQNTLWSQPGTWITGSWADLNSLGNSGGSVAPDFVQGMRWLLGPVGFSKFYAPLSIFILGVCAWLFFRAHKFAPSVCFIGALAVCLNSTYFAGACWGVGAQEIAIGMSLLAMALVLDNADEPRASLRYIRLALAGLCLGVNVMEGADIGALLSMFVAAFTFFQSIFNSSGNWVMKTVRGAGRVFVISLFAVFIAFQMVVTLVGTQIKGVAGTAQNSETKAEHWDWATQWSLPKIETLGLFVPGLFGYKQDTPKDMMPQFQDAYQGGAYWGGIGRSPEIDRFLDKGGRGQMPQGFMRFTGGGNYCGILVFLLAAWTVAQSMRKKDSFFSKEQKKMIWFWAVILVASLLLSWGRFAPVFYGTLYQLPYFSTIRNPAKFLNFFSLAIVVLFVYGLQELTRPGTFRKSANAMGIIAHLSNWWGKAAAFERKWILVCIAVWGGSVAGWLVFSAQKNHFVNFLQRMGFPDGVFAAQIASFCLGQIVWFIILFAVAMALLTLTLAGYFSDARCRAGMVLLGAFLVFDLGRANLPYIVHWDYKQKYEVGSLNPIEKILTDKPYEHRVAKLLPPPLSTPSQFQLFDQLYGIEWTQHHFPYYNIQSLDIIQMSRMPEDLLAYQEALRIGIKQNSAGQYMLDETTFPELTRLWELSNTRYLLGPAGFLDLFNSQFDPGQHRFRIVQRFTIALKPGISEFHQKLEELTAYPNNDGEYALFEFTGALPRAKLYASWQVNTNNQAVLKTLADLNFDPAKTVLVDMPQKDLPDVATNENSGPVEFKSYSPKHIVFAANASAPSVLLLNDKYDPNWKVTVDGKPAELLRCNYIMRGVYLPAGRHTVQFDFSPSNQLLYVTCAAIATGIILLGFLLFLQRRRTA